MKRIVVLSGVAAALGGAALIGGCSSQVMGERRYVPAPAEEDVVQPPAASDRQERPARIGNPENAGRSELPRFNEFSGGAATDGGAGGKAPEASVIDRSVGEGGVYVVKPGDSCYKIARAHKVSLQALIEANGLQGESASRLRVGQKLTIPSAGAVAAAPRPPAKRTADKSGGADVKPVLSDDGYYVVQPGDNVPKIARKLGVKWSELMSVNNLTEDSARRLQIGQKLSVPGRATAPVASVPQQAGEDKKAAAVLDDADSALDDAKAAGEAKAVNEAGSGDSSNTAAAAPESGDASSSGAAGQTPSAAAGSAAETKEAPAQEEAVAGASMPVEIKEDVTVEKFAADNKIAVDVFKKLNEDSLPPDGMLRAGSIVFVPSAD